MMVTADLAGQVLVTPYNRLNKRHRCQTARGLAVGVPGQRFSVEVENLSDEPVCLRKGTVIATVSPVDNADCLLVTDDAASPAEASEAVLDKVDLSGVPFWLLPDVQALIRRHAYTLDRTLGSIDATVHRVEIQFGTKPIRQQPYRAGHHARDMIRDEVIRMLGAKVVRQRTSEWASSVVVVPKKDGSPRLCVDYRRLNAVTEKDSYPIPRMEDCIDTPADARVFSTLDWNAWYRQIPKAPDDIDNTAFTCHIRTYEYRKLAFGLTNAPATFQRSLDIILSRMTWKTCLVDLYDVIVFSDTPENHMKALDEALTRLGRAGVTLKAKKCQFFQTSVEYPGHIISPGEMRVHITNLEALAKVGHPRTKTQLRSFLGMCKVYRRFVANYARFAAPLNHLTTKAHGDTLPAFKETQAAGFTRLRDALLHLPVLALPRRGAPFTIDVDACDTQLGCAVLQEQPESGLKPLGFYSRALQPEQRNYSATEKEGLYLVWALLHLRHYVEGSRFTVSTNHECLSWIYRLTTATGRLLRWRLRLAEFDLEVKYKKGANHRLPDALSRIPTTGLDEKELDDDIPCFLLAQAARGMDATTSRRRCRLPQSPRRSSSAHKARMAVASSYAP